MSLILLQVEFFFLLLGNFPFMEFYIRKRAVESKFGQDYLVVEKYVEELFKKRLNEKEENQVSDYQ